MRRLMTLVLFLLPLTVVIAQDEPPPCDIDLSDVAASLIQAQAEASGGDSDAALATLDDVLAQIVAIQAACDGQTDAAPEPSADIEPEATPDAEPVELPSGPRETYVSPMGQFSFEHPADWVLIEEGLTVFAGSSQQAASAMTAPDGVVPSGDVGAAVVIGTAPDIAPNTPVGSSPEVIASAYQTTFNFDLGYTVSQTGAVSINGQTGSAFNFAAPGFDGVVIVFDLGAADALALVLAVAPVNNMAVADDLARDIAESVRFNG